MVAVAVVSAEVAAVVVAAVTTTVEAVAAVVVITEVDTAAVRAMAVKEVVMIEGRTVTMTNTTGEAEVTTTSVAEEVAVIEAAAEEWARAAEADLQVENGVVAHQEEDSDPVRTDRGIVFQRHP